MTRAALLTVPIAALISWAAVATVIRSGDVWLALILLAAALYFLLIPVLFPRTEDREASTASAPSADPAPSTGALEAAPVGNPER